MSTLEDLKEYLVDTKPKIQQNTLLRENP